MRSRWAWPCLWHVNFCIGPSPRTPL